MYSNYVIPSHTRVQCSSTSRFPSDSNHTNQPLVQLGSPPHYRACHWIHTGVPCGSDGYRGPLTTEYSGADCHTGVSLPGHLIRLLCDSHNKHRRDLAFSCNHCHDSGDWYNYMTIYCVCVLTHCCCIYNILYTPSITHGCILHPLLFRTCVYRLQLHSSYWFTTELCGRASWCKKHHIHMGGPRATSPEWCHSLLHNCLPAESQQSTGPSV